MFEISEENLEELEKEYDVSKDKIRDYVAMLNVCTFIQDEETFHKMLEHSISIVSSMPKRIEKKEENYKRLIRKEILTKTLTDVLISCPDDEVDIEVETMLESLNKERKK